MKKLFYFVIRYATRVSLYVFFSRLEIIGTKNIPRGKPVIFAPNHQNAFLDAFMVGGLSPIRIHYLTRADVFNNPFRWFLEALQMMPIYRIRDGFGQLSQNAGVFEACRKLFAQKKSVLIFPEGSHGEHYYLRNLTKGISRLALQSQEILEEDLWVQPVGLNYFDLRGPRRRVIMVFGQPIRVKDYMGQYQEQQAKALIAFKEEVGVKMQECMMIPEKDEFYEDKVRALPKFEHLPFDKLKASLEQVKEKVKAAPEGNRVVQSLGRLLGLVNFPAIILAQNILKNKIKDPVFSASIKWGVGFLLLPLWWSLLFTTSYFLFSVEIAAASVLGALVLLLARQELLKRS